MPHTIREVCSKEQCQRYLPYFHCVSLNTAENFWRVTTERHKMETIWNMDTNSIRNLKNPLSSATTNEQECNKTLCVRKIKIMFHVFFSYHHIKTPELLLKRYNIRLCIQYSDLPTFTAIPSLPFQSSFAVTGTYYIGEVIIFLHPSGAALPLLI